MAKVFRPSTRESSILSKIESTKEHKRRLAISSLRDCMDSLANAISMKLVENSLVETTNKNSLEEQIHGCLEKLTRASDFDIDYQVAPVRNLVPDYNVVSLYVTPSSLRACCRTRTWWTSSARTRRSTSPSTSR